MRSGLASLVLAVAVAAGLPARAHADGDDTAEAPPLPPRRAVPDLDGRPPSDADAALEAALWVPRIITSPLYLISEYVIRVPLGALLTVLEREGVIDWLFASGGQVGVIPTAFFEFGLSPSVGLYAFYDRFLFDENRISAHAATWGEDWLRLIVRDRVRLTEQTELALRFEAGTRPDQLFEGIGYDSTQSTRGRFGVERMEGRLELKISPWRRSAFEVQAGYRSLGFEDERWNGERSLLETHAVAPTGYLTGYELLFFRADLLIDTHEPTEELTRSRVRARAFAEQNAAFGGLTQDEPRLFSSWVRWGGELAVSTDFFGRGRALMLRFRTELVSSLQEPALIPFYELPDAGGRGPLSGFITGQLRGQSTLGLTLEYVWPVYALLDGFTEITVGNAFGTHYEGFDWDRLRLAWAIGIIPRFAGEHLVEISFGLGTETFENGTQLSQARLVVGARHGL
ncbi:MAG: hypothetical protein H6719_30345 [Sandaracinaceae bacterium]|nr:hypothetical protein [Sandaracinaceae bacterium]